MGIFRKKLDYSSGNGVLPKTDPNLYRTLKLPNFSISQVPDFDLMTKERDAGNIEKAFSASVDAFHNVKNEKVTREVIEKYLGALVNTLAPGLNNEGSQFLANYIGVGVGMAIVESESGLMINSKSHPSIINVYFRVQQNLGSDLSKMFPMIRDPFYLIQMAMEIGYVGARLNGSIPVQEMLASIKPNG